MLIRFDNLFGTETNRIPWGSTITSATLRFVQSTSWSTVSTSLSRMRVAWSDTATWNTTTTSGVGIQFDNIEANASPDATVSNWNLTSQRTFSGSGLTAAVQSWADGDPNNGWVLWQTSHNSWRVRTSEDATLA